MTNLPGVSNPGGYTISYVNDGDLLCSECANKADKETQDNSAQYIHWEGDSLYCDECDKEIESEYGEI